MGTGFHYLHNEKRFIVTNWHNLTGRDFFSGKNLNKQARTLYGLRSTLLSGNLPQRLRFEISG